MTIFPVIPDNIIFYENTKWMYIPSEQIINN